MDLTSEVIEKILSLSEAQPRSLVEVDGLNYSTRKLHRVKQPPLECLQLATLRGFADYVNQVCDKEKGNKLFEAMITIDNHCQVSFKSSERCRDENHELYAQANASPYVSKFSFGERYTVENFMINLQTCFKQCDQRDQLIQVAGNMSSDSESKLSDDGISQTTTVGRAVKTKVSIRNPVMLSPYRTFQEVEQVESPFVFRINSDRSGEPTLSLYESDCGEWKIKAIENIYSFLVREITGVKIYR